MEGAAEISNLTGIRRRANEDAFTTCVWVARVCGCRSDHGRAQPQHKTSHHSEALHFPPPQHRSSTFYIGPSAKTSFAASGTGRSLASAGASERTKRTVAYSESMID